MRLQSYRPSPPDAGIALVAVLWGVLLLSVLAVSFGAGAGREARLARNFLDNSEARSAAGAGVYWAVGELLKPPEERRVTPNGSTYEIAFAGSRLQVTIQDEAGKVDLNVASPALLAGLMSAAGAGPESSRRIAAAVADWRDADSLRHLDGAERADYEAAGLPRPKDGPFRLVAELRTVFGVGPELYEAVAPFLTDFATASFKVVSLVILVSQDVLCLDDANAAPHNFLPRGYRFREKLSTIIDKHLT